MQRWSGGPKEFLITWLSTTWFSYVCTGRLDFLQVCNGPALINRFGTGPYRQFVDLEMEPFCSSVASWSYGDGRWVKHPRHDRAGDDRARRALNGAVKPPWGRRPRPQVDLGRWAHRWVFGDWNFYIMRWIFHLDVAGRDSSNSFFSSVNKIRQLWARLALDLSPQASYWLIVSVFILTSYEEEKMSFYTFTSVILKKLDDWDEWVLIIEAMIRRDDVQKYVNLITVEPTESVKPPTFTFFTVKPEAAKSDDLSTGQQRDLAILRKDHKETLRTYRERTEALKNLNLFILTSVDRSNLLYLRDQITVFQKLLALKKRLAFTNRIRELEVIRKYKDLQQVPKRDSRQLDQWLLEWKRVYAETARLNLPDVQGDRCVYDFLNALRTVNVAFVVGREAILNYEIRQGKTSSIKDLLENFRNHLRTARALTSLDGGQGIFAPYGESAPKWGSGPNGGLAEMVDQGNLDQMRDGKSEIPLCICGTDHRFSECSYIRRSIRLSGWTPDSAIEKTVNHRISEVIGKLKVILDSIRSKDAKRMAEIDQSETDVKPEAGKFQTVYSSFAA